MTRRVAEKLCTKKNCVDFLSPIEVNFFVLAWRIFGKLPANVSANLDGEFFL